MKKNKKTILIVEDETDLLEMYTLALSNDNFEVLEATNGLEAIEQLGKRSANVDIILMDIIMPKMDGFGTVKKIKADDKFKKIPIIFFTNLDNEEDRKDAFEMGVSDYFVKSQYTPHELVEKINKMLV